MMKKITITILILGLLIGCSAQKGFHRGKLKKNLSQQTLVTDADIQKVLDLNPQLQKGFKLGIYFKVPEKPEEYSWDYVDWYWKDKNRDSILQACDNLKEDGIISEYIYISSSIINSEDIKSIRYGAAQHGVDAVLIVNGVLETERYTNALSPLYILLVTGGFVPGTVIDALFLSNATLWDVRNGFLYLSTEAEGIGSITRPAFLAEEKDAVEEAKLKSIESLAPQIENRIKSMAKK